MLEVTIGRRRCRQLWEVEAGGTDGVVWFGRLEEEDQRLKKHYGRWMDIVREARIIHID